jgi:hypothetical protein
MDIIGNAEDTDYLFCHTDMSGFKYNRQVLLESGLDPNSIKKYKAVYTGHIHYAQKQRNIRMIGCPFELTRSDIGNQKSLWRIDLATGKETEFKNTTSPRFLRVKLKNLFDLTVDELNKKFKNNFVDIYVSDDWSTSFPFGQFTDLIQTAKKLNFILSGDDEINTNLVITDGNGSVDMSTLIETYVNELQYNDTIKKKLKDAANAFYVRTLKNLEE